MPGLRDDTVEMQELWCHACEHYVQFEIDLALDGNHVLHCPNCDHEHCRVVRNGRITEERWDQRNGVGYAQVATYYITSATASTNSMATTGSSANVYLYSATTTGGWYS